MEKSKFQQNVFHCIFDICNTYNKHIHLVYNVIPAKCYQLDNNKKSQTFSLVFCEQRKKKSKKQLNIRSKHACQIKSKRINNTKLTITKDLFFSVYTL